MPASSRCAGPRAAAVLALGRAGPASPAARSRRAGRELGLDAPLFYQLLLGEIELRDGEAGTAYQLMLDAARRTRDEQLFRRATEIALQARAGDQALAAVRGLAQALPESRGCPALPGADAGRAESRRRSRRSRCAPLLAPHRPHGAPALIAALPRFLRRATDRAPPPTLIEQALQPYAEAAGDAQRRRWSRIGRGWLGGRRCRPRRSRSRAARSAGRSATPKALPCSRSTCCPATPEAEAIVQRLARGAPGQPERAAAAMCAPLPTSQRYAEAVAQLEVLTRREPQLAPTLADARCAASWR